MKSADNSADLEAKNPQPLETKTNFPGLSSLPEKDWPMTDLRSHPEKEALAIKGSVVIAVLTMPVPILLRTHGHPLWARLFKKLAWLTMLQGSCRW